MTDPTTVVHAEDDDLESYAGEVIPDPWDDPSQEDWPSNHQDDGVIAEDEPEPFIGHTLLAAAAAWVVTKNLLKLLSEFNILGPKRDKRSDGTIGDLAHQNESASGHNPDRTGRAEYKDGDSKNEVRALDVDSSGPFLYGQTMETIVQHLVAMARAAYKAGKYFPLRYIIYKRRIWSASSGWVTKTYKGASPHTEHAHFSGAYSQKADEDSTFNYGIATLGKPKPPAPVKDDFMGYIDNQAQFEAAMVQLAKNSTFAQNFLTSLMGAKYGSEVFPGRRLGDLARDLHGERDANIGDPTGKDPKYSKVTPASPLGQLLALPATMKAAFADSAARDAQDAARDAALAQAVESLINLVKAGGSPLSDSQFQELKSAIGQRIVEAGQDAADAVHAQVTEALNELDNGFSSDDVNAEVTA